MPRCQGGGAAARWAYGPLPAPPARAGRVGMVFASFNGHGRPLSPPAGSGLVPLRRREIWWTVDVGRRGPVTRMSPQLSASAPCRTPHIGNQQSNDRRMENGNEGNYRRT